MAFYSPGCGVLPFIKREEQDGGSVEGEYNEAPVSKTAEGVNSTVGDGSVDLKGRPVSKVNTGGWKIASLIFGAVMFECIASVGIAFTLFSYLSGPMHLPQPRASIHTNIYWGTSFLTPLLGGFISDAYLGRFWTSLIAAIIELLGLTLLIISTRVGGLEPTCPANDLSCPSMEKSGRFIFLIFALYLIALGTGCLRPCLATLGADQFDIEDAKEKKKIRSYFNWFFFFMSVGAIVAMMVVVYVVQSVSWFWGFTIMGIAMLLSTACLVAGAGHYRYKKPQGSPLTRIAQVIVAAARKKNIPPPSDSAMLFEVHDHENSAASTMEPTLKRFNSSKGEVLGEPTLKRFYSLPHTKGLGFLDKAAIVTSTDTGAQSTTPVNPWRLCTITQVEELKTMMRCLPIAFIASFLYIVVAQIQTWAVAEGYTMKRAIGSFEFPPPSLSAISVAFVLVEIILYDRWFVPFMRKYTNHSHGITHLQRIGIGLVQSILAMAYGAIIETARLRSARDHNLTNNPMAVVPISIFWLLPMWILASSSELFVYVGCFEFFWQEMPVEMRSLGGGLSLLTIAIGFYQSGGLLALTNLITKSNNGGWLTDANLNKNHLNYFYILLTVLSVLNFFAFFMITKWYNYVKFIDAKSSQFPALGRAADTATSPVPAIFQRSESTVPLKHPLEEAPNGEEFKNQGARGIEGEFKRDGGRGIEGEFKRNGGGGNGFQAGGGGGPVTVDGNPDSLPRSESRTPLRPTNNSPEMRFSSPTPPPRSPLSIFSHVFSPRHDVLPVAAPQSDNANTSSPRFIKLDRSRSTRAQSK